MSALRILVVEDDAIESMGIQHHLESFGYEVIGVASRGEDAVQMASEYLPDIILMDILLKGNMDGIEAYEKIKKQDIPVIYLTSYSDEDTMEKAQLTDPFAYIIKPFEARELKFAIETAIYKKTMERKLKESEEKYRILFDNARDMITLNEVKENGLPGNFTEVNKTGLKRLGYRYEKFLEMTPADIISLDKRADILKNATELENQGYGEFEIIHVTRSGKKIPVEVNNHVFKLNGKKVALAISRDITERKSVVTEMEDSLKEKDRILREIHHQIQNNMQIIAKLLKLQKNRSADEHEINVLEGSYNRLRALVLLHEKLYSSSELTQLNMAEYIPALLSDLFQSYHIDPHNIIPLVDIDDIKLNIETASSIGLIINEIVSNSLQHAFTSGEQGELTLSLQKYGDEFKLLIGDNGKGFPEGIDFEKTESLGFQLVNALIKKINGEIELDRSQGTCFIIKFKELNPEELNPENV